MIKKTMLFLVWFFVWVLLAWPPSVSDMVTAIIVSFIVCLMTLDIIEQTYDKGYAPAFKNAGFAVNALRLFWCVAYVIVFAWECLKANIDVAYRVLHPDLPIRPGTVKVKTRLKSDIGLTFLANSITLTPGTTSVDIDRERGHLYIHWLYVQDGYDEEGKGLPVVGRFEKILQRIFE